MAPNLNAKMRFVSATKGIENTSLLRMSQVMQSELPPETVEKIAKVNADQLVRIKEGSGVVNPERPPRA